MAKNNFDFTPFGCTSILIYIRFIMFWSENNLPWEFYTILLGHFTRNSENSLRLPPPPSKSSISAPVLVAFGTSATAAMSMEQQWFDGLLLDQVM